MPIIKSAKKALRQTKTRTARNKNKKLALRLLLAKFRKTKDPQTLNSLYSQLDKMAKTNIIHKNKARRIKSRLSKTVTVKTPSIKSTKNTTTKVKVKKTKTSKKTA